MRLTAIVLLVLGLAFALGQAIVLIPYHDGRCGAQKWQSLIWSPWETAEGDFFDEYGIVEEWMKAHKGQQCPFLWEPGEFAPATQTEYFPPLHFTVASQTDIKTVAAEFLAASTHDLRRKDKLGRTILHWLVLRPERERTRLITEVTQRGLSLDDKDNDGLTPRDWAQNAGIAVPP